MPATKAAAQPGQPAAVGALGRVGGREAVDAPVRERDIAEPFSRSPRLRALAHRHRRRDHPPGGVAGVRPRGSAPSRRVAAPSGSAPRSCPAAGRAAGRRPGRPARAATWWPSPSRSGTADGHRDSPPGGHHRERPAWYGSARSRGWRSPWRGHRQPNHLLDVELPPQAAAITAIPAIAIIAWARHKERFDPAGLVNSAALPRMGEL
jgi:hypothetical protein